MAGTRAEAGNQALVVVCPHLRPHPSLQTSRPPRRSKFLYNVSTTVHHLTGSRYMLTGIDKFDLRDDEWMMVEDELLQTAKLFTQHLHLAEYETLKAKMEEQRKIATPRAVVAGTKPSAEGHFQNKAQEQAKKQKQAMRKILVSQDESSEDDGPLPSSPLVPPRINLSREDPPLTGKSIRPLREPSGVSARNTNASSDSDDLDAARRSIKIEPTLPNKAAVPPSPSVLEARHHSFKKPEIPIQTRKTVRSQRRNLWDEWDTVDLKSPSTTSKSSHSVSLQLDKSPTKISRSTTAQKSLSPTKPASTSTAHASSAPTRHFRNNTLDSADVSASTRKSLTYRTPDRSGKRKADEQQDSKKKPKFDDIPTFLF